MRLYIPLRQMEGGEDRRLLSQLLNVEFMRGWACLLILASVGQRTGWSRTKRLEI
jgi:hypothetical protein